MCIYGKPVCTYTQLLGGIHYLIITQDTLIKQIAEKQNTDIVTVRDILKTTEDVIFDLLSSTAPCENIVIKLLSGITVERKYVEKKEYSKGLFQNIICQPHVNTKANLSKYYNKRLNEKLFNEQSF